MEEKYYTTGEFRKLTHVTKKTLRYYNDHDILKPAKVTENGNHLYTDAELVQMQQILLLKFLGFSLNEIKEITINSGDVAYMKNSLDLQLRLVRDRMEQLQLVSTAIEEMKEELDASHAIDWSQMREVIELTGMETSLQKQYQNASNISARINLHKQYSTNEMGWFPWIFSLCEDSPKRVLELGCGDGSFWLQNASQIWPDAKIVVSDISNGMVRDARRLLLDVTKEHRSQFSFQVVDAEHIPFADDSFDLVIANHVLFYCEDIDAACREVARVLRRGGTFLCSTYGTNHMKEVTTLVQGFDNRIVLSAEQLFHRFGRENGAEILSGDFSSVAWKSYEDALLVKDAEPLISYILSCHGNQNQFILDKYKDFSAYVKKRVGKDGYRITKDAGAFVARNV